MRVLLGMVGVLLLLVAVAGLVLGAVCGVEVDDVALELGVTGFEAEVDDPPAPTACAACECQECVRHRAGVAEVTNERTDQRTAQREACRYQRSEGTHEASGAAGVQHGTTNRHDDIVDRELGSGRFTGAPA